jgi:RNA polymerase sigma-70 factor (ECF subfamily)
MSPALRALETPGDPAPVQAAAVAPAQLAQVYEECADFVFRMLQRLGVKRADVEDLCHDVFLVAHAKLGRLDGKVAINAWLFGICLRVAANYRRRARHRHPHIVVEDASSLQAPTMGEPDQQLARRQAQQRAQAVLDSMDLTKRAVFMMYEIEGMPCQSIAEQLGVPVGTVYSRLHSARALFEREAERFAGDVKEGR